MLEARRLHELGLDPDEIRGEDGLPNAAHQRSLAMAKAIKERNAKGRG